MKNCLLPSLCSAKTTPSSSCVSCSRHFQSIPRPRPMPVTICLNTCDLIKRRCLRALASVSLAALPVKSMRNTNINRIAKTIKVFYIGCIYHDCLWYYPRACKRPASLPWAARRIDASCIYLPSLTLHARLLKLLSARMRALARKFKYFAVIPFQMNHVFTQSHWTVHS